MRSFGTIERVLDTPSEVQPIVVLLDIESVYISAVLGLDILDVCMLLVDNFINRILHRKGSNIEPLEE